MNNFSIQPMFPDDATNTLVDLSADLLTKSGFLAGAMRPQTQQGVADLVRSMNCYYSNLIEGHRTTPREIDDAMRDSYSDDPKKRNLQLEARQHIETQKKIDTGDLLDENPASERLLTSIHYEFCNGLPKEMLEITNPDTGKMIKVIPGRFREDEVKVGRHIPPAHTEVPYFMELFRTTYDPSKLSKIKSIIAVAASHHRLVWIHPFADGNGRVARLFSHAYLLKLGVGCSLWSISRGLARTTSDYKMRLAAADDERHGDYDGRGALSNKQLYKFCCYFLECCIDQIDYMTKMIDPKSLEERIAAYCLSEISAGNLPKTSDQVLRTALTAGQIERGEMSRITGYQERRARDVLTSLINKNLLVSTGPRKPVRLGFPADVADKWFPGLYSPE